MPDEKQRPSLAKPPLVERSGDEAHKNKVEAIYEEAYDVLEEYAQTFIRNNIATNEQALNALNAKTEQEKQELKEKIEEHEAELKILEEAAQAETEEKKQELERALQQDREALQALELNDPTKEKKQELAEAIKQDGEFFRELDSRKHHQTTWHQWGILTHTKKVWEYAQKVLFDGETDDLPRGEELRRLFERIGNFEQLGDYLNEQIDPDSALGLTRLDLFQLSIPFHDLGKFMSQWDVNGKRRVHTRHEERSGNVVGKEDQEIFKFLKEKGLSETEIKYIEYLCRYHFELGKIRDAAKNTYVNGEPVGYTLPFLAEHGTAVAINMARDTGGEEKMPLIPAEAPMLGIWFLFDSMAKTEHGVKLKDEVQQTVQSFAETVASSSNLLKQFKEHANVLNTPVTALLLNQNDYTLKELNSEGISGVFTNIALKTLDGMSVEEITNELMQAFLENNEAVARFITLILQHNEQKRGTKDIATGLVTACIYQEPVNILAAITYLKATMMEKLREQLARTCGEDFVIQLGRDGKKTLEDLYVELLSGRRNITFNENESKVTSEVPNVARAQVYATGKDGKLYKMVLNARQSTDTITSLTTSDVYPVSQGLSIQNSSNEAQQEALISRLVGILGHISLTNVTPKNTGFVRKQEHKKSSGYGAMETTYTFYQTNIFLEGFDVSNKVYVTKSNRLTDNYTFEEVKDDDEIANIKNAFSL